VTVSSFKDKTYVHVRVYDEQLGYPTPVGVALTPSRFAMLSMIQDDVSERVDQLNKPGEFEYKAHLGGGFYCTVKSGFYSAFFASTLSPTTNSIPFRPRRESPSV